jgi:hypothetical protein
VKAALRDREFVTCNFGGKLIQIPSVLNNRFILHSVITQGNFGVVFNSQDAWQVTTPCIVKIVSQMLCVIGLLEYLPERETKGEKQIDQRYGSQCS